MVKRIFSISLFLLLLLFLPSKAEASLITVTDEGEVVVNVLASEADLSLEIPRSEYFEVKEIAEKQTNSRTSTISLEKNGEKISLKVSDAQRTKEMDVSNYKDHIIEIEQKESAKLVSIGVYQDQFSLQQKGLIALTDYPVSVDPERKELTVKTTTGEKLIGVLPMEAIESILRTRIISRVDRQSPLELKEDENGDLYYLVKGQKVVNLFNVYDYKIDVSAKVSALTGEVLTIENPSWLRAVNFLFV